MSSPTLLLVSGALRQGSTNMLLLREAARLFGPCEAIEADLRLPLYDNDIEDRGIPDEVLTLVRAMAGADAVLFSTPEYNKNLSGVLKNALDWVSRVRKDGKTALDGKPVAIMSATAGRSGGERAQFSLRHCLTPFNPRPVQMPEVFIAQCRDAFGEDGRLKDEFSQKLLAGQMEALKAEIARG